MKKRVYRATKVKDLNLEQLEKETDGKEIILGVDVAKEDFMAAIMTKDRKVISTIIRVINGIWLSGICRSSLPRS